MFNFLRQILICAYIIVLYSSFQCSQWITFLAHSCSSCIFSVPTCYIHLLWYSLSHFCFICLRFYIVSSVMLFRVAIKDDFSFSSHGHINLSAIASVCILKCPYKSISSHFYSFVLTFTVFLFILLLFVVQFFWCWGGLRLLALCQPFLCNVQAI